MRRPPDRVSSQPEKPRRVFGLLLFSTSVRQGSVIICKHLRCGQLPSAGPRQKEGAESVRWDDWMGLNES
jgi:hypothetical protein